jgi:hypothetical protein
VQTRNPHAASHAASFDTLKYSNTLKAAGVAPPQAEAQAFALAQAFDDYRDQLATRNDLKLMDTGLRGEMAQLRAEFKGEMAELRADVAGKFANMKWMLSVIGLGVAAILPKLYLH